MVILLTVQLVYEIGHFFTIYYIKTERCNQFTKFTDENPILYQTELGLLNCLHNYQQIYCDTDLYYYSIWKPHLEICGPCTGYCTQLQGKKRVPSGMRKVLVTLGKGV